MTRDTSNCLGVLSGSSHAMRIALDGENCGKCLKFPAGAWSEQRLSPAQAGGYHEHIHAVQAGPRLGPAVNISYQNNARLNLRQYDHEYMILMNSAASWQPRGHRCHSKTTAPSFQICSLHDPLGCQRLWQHHARSLIHSMNGIY